MPTKHARSAIPGVWGRFGLAGGVALILALPARATLPALPRAVQSATPAAVATDPLLLAIRLNGRVVADFVPVVRDGEAYFVPAADFLAWRLRVDTPPRRIDAADWHALPGQIRLDQASQTLVVDAPASAFVAQAIDVTTPRDPADPAPELAGLALDYDVSVQRGQGDTQAAALLDLHAFGLPGVPGVPRARLVVREHADGLDVLRLDTQWRVEDVTAMRSRTLGDSLTCNGELGSTARFGGVQMQRDFSLRPDLVTWPLPSLSGSASLPSALDLVVNGQTVGTHTVDSGPFQLDQVPLVSGAGEVAVVQRDVLGRETRVVVPYYLSPRLLRPGLFDYCAEAGRLRENYGAASNDYGAGFAALGVRWGLDAATTALARVEISEISGLQIGFNALLGRWGVASAQFAASHSSDGSGVHGQLRIERQAARFSFAAGVEAASGDYQRLAGEALPRWRANLFGGLPLALPGLPHASLGFSAIWQQSATGERDQLASLTLAGRVGRHWSGQLGVQSRNGEVAALFTASRSLDNGVHLGVYGQHDGERLNTTVSAQQSEPAAGGLGWRIAASEGASARQQAGASWLHRSGRVTADVARDDSATALRLGARGGVLWAGGRLHLSRALGDGAMARVRVPGVAGVPVLHQNRVVGVTDAAGVAWVAGLLPHQMNRVGIDINALPLAISLDRDALQVRPPARGVVDVVFAVSAQRKALVSVVDSAGKAIPPGALATDANGLAHPFGHHGEVYLDVLDANNRLGVSWGEHRCSVEFPLPDGVDPQPHIGPLVCRSTT